MSRLSLKGLKYAAFASQETLCFEAVICLDGKPMFSARNDGHGGADFYTNLPKQSGADFNAAYAAVDAAARAEAPQFFKGACGDGGHAYSLGMEALIGTLVNEALTLRDLRRALKGKVLFMLPGDKPGSFRSYKVPAQTPTFQVEAFAAKKHPGAVILNAMPEAEALALWTRS